MQNSVSHRYHKKDEEQQQSQCPECGNRYSSSQSESEGSGQESQERIMIPLHKDLFKQNQNQNQVEGILQNLQKEVQNLKFMNRDKDRMIQEMKKQMDHKMTHHIFYGELQKHTDQIVKLKGEIERNQQMNRLKSHFGNRDLQNDQYVRKKQKTQMDSPQSTTNYQKKPKAKRKQSISDSFGQDFNLKSTFDIISKKTQHKKQQKQWEHKRSASENAIFLKRVNTDRTPFLQNPNDQYYENGRVPVFKISDAKKRITYLEDVVRRYEEEILWLHNFANVFVKSISSLADKKYGERIMMSRWNLKKKVKMSWRYLKHLLAYLYSEST